MRTIAEENSLARTCITFVLSFHAGSAFWILLVILRKLVVMNDYYFFVGFTLLWAAFITFYRTIVRD